MTRLIDADSLEADCNIYDAWDAQIVKEWLNDQPTVDAEPVKHGHWIELTDSRISCVCSVCGQEYYLHEDDICGYPYCAKCGAKMDEEIKE